MRISFIVCEYNPLHNGHIKLIEHTKNHTACDKLVLIMSGDVMQRGELPIVDKYTRASWAIKAGADMVIELPPIYSLGSAQIFATGAKKIINIFDCEKYLSFGSECGSVYVLETLCEMMQSSEYESLLKAQLQDKVSYAKATFLALEKYLDNLHIDKSIASIITKPNNTLALEYIKATQSVAINYHTLKREGDFLESLDAENPSANSIRNLLKEGLDVSSYLPKYVLDDLKVVKNNDEKLFSIIKYELPKKNNLDNIFGMVEGIHNRFLSSLKNSHSLNEYLDNVKNKRFTRTSLQRALLNALLDNTRTFEQVMNTPLEYVNILAINDNAKQLFSIMDMDIVTKNSELEKLQKEYNFDISIEKKASQLFKSVNYEYDSFMRIIK